MIHQELALVPEMTVFDNIFLGIEKNKFGILKTKNLELFKYVVKNIGFGLHFQTDKLYLGFSIPYFT